MDGELRLSPPWKHALATLVDEGLTYGQVITKDRLVDLFGLLRPVTAEDQERFQMDFLQQFTELREELLEEHRLRLRTMYGESSYEVVHPGEQTSLAMDEGQRDLKRAIRRMSRTLAFVRHEELTDEQRRKNSDAQAKAAMLAGMVRRPMLQCK
jgi:hypothetical protein